MFHILDTCYYTILDTMLLCCGDVAHVVYNVVMFHILDAMLLWYIGYNVTVLW